MSRPTLKNNRAVSLAIEALVVVLVALIYVVLVTRGRVLHWGLW